MPTHPRGEASPAPEPESDSEPCRTPPPWPLPLAAVGLASPASESAPPPPPRTPDAGHRGTGFEASGRSPTPVPPASVPGRSTGTSPPARRSVTSAWDADVTSSGTHWTAKNKSYNDPRRGRLRILWAQRRRLGLPVQLHAQRRQLCTAAPPSPVTTRPARPAPPPPPRSPTPRRALLERGHRRQGRQELRRPARGGTKVATVTTTEHAHGLLRTDYSYTVQGRDTADQTGPVSGAVAVHHRWRHHPAAHRQRRQARLLHRAGIYGRNYNVKNLVTSGSAAKITHINYAFGNVTNGQCAIGDSYADYDKAFTADQSVSGAADTGRAAARQLQPAARAEGQVPEHQDPLVLRRLDLVRLVCLEAAANPTAFAQSCYNLVEDPRWPLTLRWHPHRLGVPERLRPVLRHQRRRGLQEPDAGPARQVRHQQPGHRGHHGGRHLWRQDRRRRLRGRLAVRRLVQRDVVPLLR